MTDILPILIIIGVYGAASAALTAAIRKTLAKYAPAIEAKIKGIEIVKRLLPCLVAFALLSGTDSAVLSWFGVSVAADTEIMSVRWSLALLSGIFSGWAWHWVKDWFKGR